MHFYNESSTEDEKHSLIFLLIAQLFLDLYIVGVYGLLSIKQPVLLSILLWKQTLSSLQWHNTWLSPFWVGGNLAPDPLFALLLLKDCPKPTKPSSLGVGKEDQHYSISISPLFCSLLSTSNITTKRNRNLFPPISATKENLFYAAVIDHEPEIKYHRICTNVESTEENKQPQRFMTSYSCNILQQFTCFLVSAQLAFLACCAATRALISWLGLKASQPKIF